ncbi:MAG: hypothetical protein ABI665_06130 [Vicinamibacterales bacterium]
MRFRLANELDAIRKRHANDPPHDLLLAARADLLPAKLQARANAHLAQDAWSRAIVEGFEQSGADDSVDVALEERLLGRIQGGQAVAVPPARRRTWTAVGGLALAATVLIGVFIGRERPTPGTGPAAPPPPAASSTAAAASPAAQPPRLTFTKPDVKWGAGALTWRGAPSDPSFITDLTPAMDAYSKGDYARAESSFEPLSARYPGSIEVLFYLGLTRMLRGDFTGALQPLAAAERLKNVTFADDASWFLGVAEQRSGQVVQSRARLAVLCDKGGDRAADACAAVAVLDAATRPAPANTR